MEKIPRFRHRPLHSLGRRVGTSLRRSFLGRFVAGKRVRLVEIGNAHCKRLTLDDAWSAARMAESLERFAPLRLFPSVVAQVGNELLLDFVEGTALPDPLDAATCDRLAAFFGALYAHERRSVASAACIDAVVRDLAFLARTGVLAAAAQRDLEHAAAARAPARLELGHDYLDPIPRNFVITPEGRLVAIDVEELLPDQILGTGVAKAVLRMPGAARERLLAGIRSACGLDLTPAMPFVELAFLAGWTKRALLKGRAKLVDPALFEPHRMRTGD